MVMFTQALFYGLPWLQWDGRQAVLLDLSTRKFYFFGMILWPQDVIFLALLLIISAYGLFLFTAIAGRLFCGYACPQTVYTEIFMWIERKVEGDRLARIRLDGSDWNARKIGKKALKHGLWIAVALWTGFTFVGYFTPILTLAGQVISASLGPWQTFWILFYGFRHLWQRGVHARAGLQVHVPLARFQSVMIDKDTLVVTYDTNGASRAVSGASMSIRARKARAIAWTAASACKSARRASISAMACNTCASAAAPVSMPAIRSWTRWVIRAG
jgi:Polyferredoxin